MNQTETVINEDTLAAGADLLRSQISLLQKRVKGDDLTRNLFESALISVDSLLQGFNGRLDAEADDYNALVEQFEAFQAMVNDGLIKFTAKTGLPATAESLGSVIHEYVEAQIMALSNQESLLQQANTLRLSAEADLRRYKKEYPSSLVTRLDSCEKDNRSLKKDRRELREQVASLNSASVKLQGEGVSLRKKIAVSQSIIEQLKRECTVMGEDLNRACGMQERPETFPVRYHGEDAIAYIHTYPNGLTAITGQRGEALLTANFHLQIRTNRLLTMDVVPSIWGTPLYFRIPGFDEEWNSDIDECLSDKIMALIEADFPRLFRRIKDSQAAPVDELKMRPSTMESIKSFGFKKVHDVACIPSCFHKDMPFMQGDCRQEIIDSCRVWANEWDKANGGVEKLYVSK